MRSLEQLAKSYGAYFDHNEAQNYAPLLVPGQRTTYREKARRYFVKYCMTNRPFYNQKRGAPLKGGAYDKREPITK